MFRRVVAKVVSCGGVLAQGAMENAKVVQTSCQVPHGHLGLRNRQAYAKTRVPFEESPVASESLALFLSRPPTVDCGWGQLVS